MAKGMIRGTAGQREVRAAEKSFSRKTSNTGAARNIVRELRNARKRIKGSFEKGIKQLNREEFALKNARTPSQKKKAKERVKLLEQRLDTLDARRKKAEAVAKRMKKFSP